MNDIVQRGAGGRFLPGVSPNPTGRPKVVEEIRDLAREHAPDAFAKICKLINSNDERTALAAAQEVLNRAYGKPVQAVQSDVRKFDMTQLYLDATRYVNQQASNKSAGVIEGEFTDPAANDSDW